MTQEKNNFNNIIALVPQVMRLCYKIFRAWRTDGISIEEARDIAEEVFTVVIFVLEEFELHLEDEDGAEEPEDDAEELSEEQEWSNLEDEHEAVIGPEKAAQRKRIFKKRGK